MPFVLCTTGVLLCLLAGCKKEEKAPAGPPANSPAVYMKDPAFMKKLDDKRAELLAVVQERQPLVERMKALIREHGEELSELQKVPEWNDLHKKVVALNEKYAVLRKQQLAILGKRLQPAEKKVSK